MATWPATLPEDALRRAFRESPADNLVRSKNDAGPDKVRRRTTANVKRLQISMSMTDDQVDDFMTFYETTLKSGSLTFTMDHPRTKVSTTFRFGRGVPEITPDGARFFVDFELEILP